LFDEVLGGVGDEFELGDSAAADGRGELGVEVVEPGGDVGAEGPADQVEEGPGCAVDGVFREGLEEVGEGRGFGFEEAGDEGFIGGE
jgi:hypothetical protein